MCTRDNRTHIGDRTTAPFLYEGEIRSRILRLKYANERRIAAELGRDVAHHAIAHGMRPDVVTWIPTTRRKLRRRGIDHAELIAEHVARQLRIPCRQLLMRANNMSQTGQTRRVRLSQVRFRSRRLSPDICVLVVDDVVTTGASMRAARQALKSSGAGIVHCIAVAITAPR